MVINMSMAAASITANQIVRLREEIEKSNEETEKQNKIMIGLSIVMAVSAFVNVVNIVLNYI